MATKEAKKAKMEAPNKEEFDTAQQKISSEIETLHAELATLNRKISEKSTGKEEFLQRKSEMKAKLDEYQRIISQCEKERKEYYDQLQSKRDEDRAARGKLNDFKKGLKFDTIEEIDREIAKIERKMQTTSMSLKDEKQCIVQIKELKANKPQIMKYSQMEASTVGGGADAGVSVKQKIDELKARIEGARAAKKQQSDQYQVLIDQRQKVMADVQGEWEERDKINKKISAKIRERRDIQDEFQRQMREFQTWRAEQQAIRYEKTKAERLQRQADNEKWRAEQVAETEEEQPHLVEITLIEQTLTYCKGLLPKEEKATEEKKDTTFNNPEGSKVLVTKNARDDEENMFSGVVKAKKKDKKTKKAEPKMDAKITHAAGSLQIFTEVGTKVPLTIGDVPPIVAQLEEKLKGLMEDVKKWESEQDERKKKREIAKAEALARAEAKAKEAQVAKEAALARAREVQEAEKEDA